jgi:SOS-response transcriptional repressor LexA
MAPAKVLHIPMTPARRRLLLEIERWLNANNYAPSERELARAMGVAAVSTVHAHLKILREQGHVTWVAGLPRTLSLTDSGREILSGSGAIVERDE